MKPEYDFSRGERGRFFRGGAELTLPEGDAGTSGMELDFPTRSSEYRTKSVPDWKNWRLP